MENIIRRMDEGYKAVLVAGPRLLQETAEPELDKLRRPEIGFGDSQSPRTMVRFAREHLHPWDRSLFRDELDLGRPSSFLYWEVPGSGHLMHCLHLHLVCVQAKGLANLSFRHTIDGGDFIKLATGDSKHLYTVMSSDEVMYFNTAPRTQSAHLLTVPMIDWRAYSHWCLSTGISRINLFIMSHGVRFIYDTPDTKKWSTVEKRASTYCNKVIQRLDNQIILLYAQLHFAINLRLGETLRRSPTIVKIAKWLRALLGLDY